MATTDTATRVLENYVGGRWTASSSTELLDVTNPAGGNVIARVPLSTASELDAAVAAARDALPAWRAVAVPERARRLFALRGAGLRTRCILQIHDELLFEGPAEEAERATEIVCTEMVAAADIDPPLTVDAGVGPNWLDAK